VKSFAKSVEYGRSVVKKDFRMFERQLQTTASAKVD